MTEFILIRHGAHDLIGTVLAGRAIDVPLNAEGHAQARAIAAQLRGMRIDRVLSSPRRRARETAAPIAAVARVPLEIATALDEHNSGVFGGQRFAALERNPRWREWNGQRGAARPPAGETMAELQRRIVGYLSALSRSFPEARIVAVTHAEPIRAVLMQARGIALDDFMQADVPIASVHRLCLSQDGDRIEERMMAGVA